MGRIVTMGQIAIVVHGGAGPDSEFILKHIPEYEKGLSDAVEAGYSILKKGGSALDAVEAAIISLENNKYFNAGRGSAITAAGNVEMCASMMDGKEKKAGATAIINNIKNPISFAKELLKDGSLMYMGGAEATETAKDMGIKMEPDSYFITEHQWDAFEKERKKKGGQKKAYDKHTKRQHGTVGAVALDIDGNLAAGTSTGGTEYCQPGRIGDSSIIGVGTYADNKTAAVSCTGDGEFLITEVMAYNIAATVEHTGCTIQEAIDHVILVKNEDKTGDLGAIGIDSDGNIGVSFNSERMHRAWRTREDFGVKIYK
ncbi:isoaspartyl peptidase/L-asparaginase [Fluviicola sp.]|uniref:isoaspartyl peptidase/L-asparaginase family protein n=1 Tax=Fluviicola sp. TaxID=1917219 RepID=UPI0031D9564F